MEKIICSAIHFLDTNTPVHRPTNIHYGTVLCGHRHPHIIGQVTALLGKKMSEMQPYVQGFLTDKNRFVDRKEGMNIAVSASQLIRYTNSDKLFSEDIY